MALGVVSGVGLLLATAILLLKDGEHTGQTLTLLNNYFPGFHVSWSGVWIGGGSGSHRIHTGVSRCIPEKPGVPELCHVRAMA